MAEDDKLKNPYDEGDDGQEFVLGSGGKFTRLFIGLFLLAIVVPPVGRHLYEFSKPKEDRWLPVAEFFHHPNGKSKELLAGKKKGNPGIARDTPGIRDHLQSFEKGVDSAPFTNPPQRFFQSLFTKALREGNPKCFVGQDGWFFYRPSLDAIGGYGPLKPEPDSVTKDPDRPIWSPPLPEVVRFANDLKERGVPLLLVPVPVKAMIYPEHTGAKSDGSALTHHDRDTFYAQLNEAGVETLDLLPTMMAAKAEGQVFLKQDTHWTTLGMEAALAAVVEKVKGMGLAGSGDLQVELRKADRSHMGDLVGMLEIDTDAAGFLPESQEVAIVTDSATGEVVAPDRRAPIALLADSFVNVYHDPMIGFGDPNWSGDGTESPIGAGFGQHLAARLGQRIDLVAKNGGGATASRQEFALRRQDDIVRSKKLVIWLLAERDLFLSATPAGSDVLFRPVKWNDNDSEPAITNTNGEPNGESLVLNATLKARSAVNDPKATPYPDSLFTAEFTVDEIVSGEFSETEAHVVLWGFRNREYTPSAHIEEGKAYQIRLVPFSTKAELQSLNLADDLLLFSDQYFAEKIEPFQ